MFAMLLLYEQVLMETGVLSALHTIATTATSGEVGLLAETLLDEVVAHGSSSSSSGSSMSSNSSNSTDSLPAKVSTTVISNLMSIVYVCSCGYDCSSCNVAMCAAVCI
jgi:spore maturation protein SpmB